MLWIPHVEVFHQVLQALKDVIFTILLIYRHIVLVTKGQLTVHALQVAFQLAFSSSEFES